MKKIVTVFLLMAIMGCNASSGSHTGVVFSVQDDMKFIKLERKIRKSRLSKIEKVRFIQELKSIKLMNIGEEQQERLAVFEKDLVSALSIKKKRLYNPNIIHTLNKHGVRAYRQPKLPSISEEDFSVSDSWVDLPDFDQEDEESVLLQSDIERDLPDHHDEWVDVQDTDITDDVAQPSLKERLRQFKFW